MQIYRILLISKDPYNDVVKSCFWTGISEIVNRVQERMTQKLTIIYIYNGIIRDILQKY